MSLDDISHRFNFHPANDEEKKNEHSAIRTSQELAHFLDDRLPNEREKALAITKLEEVMSCVLGQCRCC